MTCFPPNTRENYLLDVSKNRDTEAAQESNLANKFSRQILHNFRSEPMRTIDRKHTNLGCDLHFAKYTHDSLLTWRATGNNSDWLLI